MRRRFGFILPIVALALLAQIFAPITSCWAYSVVMADPLRAAEICKPGGKFVGSTDTGSGGQMAMHDCCSACSLAQTPAMPTDPQVHVIAPVVLVHELAWRHIDDRCARQQRDRNAQARAPPVLS